MKFISILFFFLLCFQIQAEPIKITFTKSKNILHAYGRVWKAVSGSSDSPAISTGVYRIPKKSLMVGTEKVQGVPQNNKYNAPSYQDAKKFGWFLWIGKNNLGIHPDGGPKGTLGCIGLTADDTRSLFEKFRADYNKEIILTVLD